MSRQQLFLELLMSVILISGGVREMRRDNTGLGIFMLAVPGCFWLSRLLGDLP